MLSVAMSMSVRALLVALWLPATIPLDSSAATESFRIGTYIGIGLPNNVPADETNVWCLGIAVDASTEIAVAANSVVRRIDSNHNIITVAGIRPPNFAENNGGLAMEADVSSAKDVEYGPDGSVYFCDSLWDVIRRILPDGTIETVAGTWGVEGSSGDGGPATSATLEDPRYLTIGPGGRIYISEKTRVRLIDATGTILAFAGNGERGQSGSGDGGPATQASFEQPQGLILDALGQLLIADEDDGRVRRVRLDGTIETVAGSLGGTTFDGDGGLATDARLGRCVAVAFDSEGNLVIGDRWNGVVRRVDSDGIIHTIAGTGVRGDSGDGGPARFAQMDEIFDLDVDDQGRIYVSDFGSSRIRRIDLDGTIQTVAGNGTPLYGGDGGPVSDASFFIPSDLAFTDGGEVFIADRGNYRVRRVDTSGVVSTYAGIGEDGWDGDGGAAIDATMNPKDLARAPDGTLYVLQTAPRIRRIDPDGTIHHFAGTGENGYAVDGGLAINGEMNRPEDIFLAPSGELYVADTDNNRLRVIGLDGRIRTIAGNGSFSSTGDGGPAIDSTMNRPGGVLVTDDGRIFVAELSGARIRMIDTNQVIHTIAGGNGDGFSGDGGLATSAQLSVPVGMYRDKADYFYFADRGNLRVRRIDPAGVIETVAGAGGTSYNGDGIPAVDANIRMPLEIVPGPEGVLYVTSDQAGRVRMLIPDTGVPVGFSGFLARTSGSRVVLSWDAADATAIAYSVLRRSRVSEVLDTQGTSDQTGRVEIVSNPGQGTWTYRVEIREESGYLLAALGPVTVEVMAIVDFPRIASVFPNPASPATTVSLDVPRSQSLSVQVYDLRGRRVATLMNSVARAGTHHVRWDGTDESGQVVSNGVYLLRVSGDRSVADARRITLLR